MALVKLPWPIVVRKDKFSALFNGGIYIGQPDAVDPRTEPKDAILIQEDGTQIPAEQPIKIGVNGLPTYNGSVVAIDVTGDFSILIVDSLDAQQYYYPNLGESSDLLVTDLRSIAFDLGLTFDDIGVKLVTDEVGTSLDNAEFILNTTTGEVWVLPTSIPPGSVVVSLSGPTLTTNNGDFELQSTSNDEYEIAPNRISVSQMVVEGATGQPLPENGTLTSYAIGNEMALGWIVTEAVVDGTKDANGNVSAASGKVRYTINKDEKGLIGVAQLFGSVMQSDGTNLTQVYADGSGITLSEDATTVWLEIDFSQSTGFFYVAGISEQRGRLESKDSESLKSGTSLVLAENPSGWVNGAVVNFDDISEETESRIIFGFTVFSTYSNGYHEVSIDVPRFINEGDIALFSTTINGNGSSTTNIFLTNCTASSVTVSVVNNTWSSALNVIYIERR